MARILIIRFSALGDVAMTIPVIHSLAVQYPQHEITVLSRAVWQPLFQSLPENVNFVGADLTGKHKGLWLLNFSSIYGEGKGDFAEIEPMTGPKGKQKWIGIAPFAKHKGKIYPLELQEQVVAHFAANPAVKVFLFGGGKSEQEVFDSWIAKYPSVVSMIGKLNMRTELNLMSHLDVMLSMDSANMHLASLVNIPVVSVWGATHPYAGFMGWKQLPVNTVQLDLSCRPCSVYGQKPCWRGDYACLRDITPEQVIAKIEGIID